MLLPSFIFGVFAWTIPPRGMRTKIKMQYIFAASFACCGVSVLLQLFDIMNRLNSGDVAGIMDTIGAVTFGLTVMMIVTAAVNTIALSLNERKG